MFKVNESRVFGNVVITRRQHDYHACLADQSEVWDCGATEFDAMGRLMIGIGYAEHKKRMVEIKVGQRWETATGVPVRVESIGQGTVEFSYILGSGNSKEQISIIDFVQRHRRDGK